MSIEDKIIDGLQEGGQSIDLFNPEETEHSTAYSGAIVPGLAQAAGESRESGRWGANNPMFNTSEDAHAFLQGLGMAPGGAWADIIDAGLYMTEGEWVNMAISLGAAVPILGMSVRSGSKAIADTGAIRKLKAAVGDARLSEGVGAANRWQGAKFDANGILRTRDGVIVNKDIKDRMIKDPEYREAWAEDFVKNFEKIGDFEKAGKETYQKAENMLKVSKDINTSPLPPNLVESAKQAKEWAKNPSKIPNQMPD